MLKKKKYIYIYIYIKPTLSLTHLSPDSLPPHTAVNTPKQQNPKSLTTRPQDPQRRQPQPSAVFPSKTPATPNAHTHLTAHSLPQSHSLTPTRPHSADIDTVSSSRRRPFASDLATFASDLATVASDPSRHFLDWEWRKRSILFELGPWSADIMCFQEVDRFQDLEVEFKFQGYTGIWKIQVAL